MSFFNKIGETLTSTSKDLAQKAKVMTEVSSLNGQIQTQEEKIHSYYMKIGKDFYEKNKSDDSVENLEDLKGISECFLIIDELKNEIQTIKGSKICLSCGKQMSNEAVFCTECGAKNENAETISESDNNEDHEKCSNCNLPLEESALFCMGCGEKVCSGGIIDETLA